MYRDYEKIVKIRALKITPLLFPKLLLSPHFSPNISPHLRNEYQNSRFLRNYRNFRPLTPTILDHYNFLYRLFDVHIFVLPPSEPFTKSYRRLFSLRIFGVNETRPKFVFLMKKTPRYFKLLRPRTREIVKICCLYSRENTAQLSKNLLVFKNLWPQAAPGGLQKRVNIIQGLGE